MRTDQEPSLKSFIRTLFTLIRQQAAWRVGIIVVAAVVLVGLYGGILAINAQGAGIIYVDDDSACSSGCGISWTDAYTTVQDALAVAGSGDEIWVAEGVYYPDEGAGQMSDVPTATFQLKAGVAVYGGFSGDETARNQRDWAANVTVLSGDIDGNDSTDAEGVVTDTANISGTNAYHVVAGSGVTTTAVLDGFIITAGHADGAQVGTCGPACGGGVYNESGSPTLANVTFTGNEARLSGGGMFNGISSSPMLTNVSFSGNRADSGGGMTNYYQSNPTLVNISFQGNRSSAGGGGIENLLECDPVLINVTFSGNHADNNGGGIYNYDSAPNIHNSIFWNNRDASGTGTADASIFDDSSSSSTIAYSLVQGQNPSGSGNLDGTDPNNNPLFVTPVDPTTAPTVAGDLRLRAGSPVIDAGDNSVVSAATDLDGEPRIVDGDNNGSAMVDMGAYEASFPDLVVTISESADPVVAGSGTGNLTYVVTVENLGAADATGVALTDTLTLPAGVTVESVTPSGSTSWNGTSHTWTVGDLASGASETLTLVLTVGPSADAGADVIANQAAVTAIDQTDTDATNDSATEASSVDTAADLVVAKADTPDPVAAGEMLTYTVAITNNGPSDAQNVVATDKMTDALTLDSTTGCAEDPNGAPTCSLGTIAAGSTAGYTMTTLVDSTTLSTTITNTVTISSTTAEAASGDESTAITTSVNVVADLELTKVDTPDPVVAGEPLTYTLTLTNHGPSQGWGVKVEDTLPLAYTHTGNNCGVSYAPPGPLEWVINDMPAGQVLTCVITGTVASGVSGAITNTASVSAISFVTDPDPSNNSLGEPTTVYDNLFSIGDATLAEGDAGTTAFTFTISRTKTTTASSVDVATIDDTATAGTDYAAVSDTVTFAAGGAPTQTVTVDVTGETLVELDETFFLSLTNPSGGGIGDGQGVGTIANDDSASLSIDDVTRDEGDAGSTVYTFTVTLDSAVDAGVNVDYATGDATATTADGDYSATSGTLNFVGSAGETQAFTVDVAGDTIVEDTEAFSVTLSGLSAGGRNVTLADAAARGTIVNDDVLTISIGNATVDESVGPAVFTVTLSTMSALTTSVDYATSDGSAVAGADYTAVSGTLDIAPGDTAGSIAVPILDDGIDEQTESFTVSLSNPVSGTIAVSTGTGTILDSDNAAPALLDVAVTSPIDENDVAILSGVLSDTVTDPLTLTIDWDDSTVVTYTYAAGTTFFTETHRYLDDDPSGTPADDYTIGLTVADDQGATTNDNATVTVNNVAPSVDAGADVDALQNETVSFAGIFSDTGTLDTHSIQWDFGDGVTASGTLTPAHIYTAAGTYTATLTVTDDDGGANMDDVRVTILPYVTFLPLAMRPAGMPDLVVNELIVTEDSIEVVVENQGTGPVEDEFWVDVYIDPTPAPSEANQTWPQLAEEGLVWGVTQTPPDDGTTDVLPLDPGDTFTLTIGDGYYDASRSNLSGTLLAGTPVYAQVDSANVDTDYGGVLESHEVSGGVYNNVAGPVFSESTRTFDIPRRRSGDIQPADMPARPRP